MNRLFSDVLVVRRVAALLGGACLRVMGWRIEGEAPGLASYVLIVAPHTSRWDSIVLTSAIFAQGLPVYWLGKDTLFRGPFGWMLRRFGGIPVDRAHGANALAHAERVLEMHPRPVLIFPEGTRAKQAHWKSGFYRLARAADVPVVPLGLDFGTKTVRWGEAIEVSGNARETMEAIRRFYAGVEGWNSERESLIEISEEGDVASD